MTKFGKTTIDTVNLYLELFFDTTAGMNFCPNKLTSYSLEYNSDYERMVRHQELNFLYKENNVIQSMCALEDFLLSAGFYYNIINNNTKILDCLINEFRENFSVCLKEIEKDLCNLPNSERSKAGLVEIITALPNLAKLPSWQALILNQAQYKAITSLVSSAHALSDGKISESETITPLNIIHLFKEDHL